MRKIRTGLIVAFSIILLTGFSWIGYRIFHRYTLHSESPFNAIPGNTALIIQLNQAGNLFEELNRSNLLWKSISHFPGINTIRNELQYIDSTSRKNPKISRIFSKYKILVNITLSGQSDFGALYLASVGGEDPESNILDFIRELFDKEVVIITSPYSTTNLHRIQLKSSREPFYFAVMKGVFIGSYHANLVKRSLDRLSLNTPMATSSGFRKVEATVGKKADANIYINYRFFSLVLSALTKEDNLPDLIKFSDFADWSGLDLIIKKDELLFNGITVASDSSQHFLSLFSDQKPQKIGVSSIIPETAHYFTSFGWSDPARFSQRLQSQLGNNESYPAPTDTVANIIDKYELNISEYFLPWMGQEACIFSFSMPGSSDDLTFSAIALQDTSGATPTLIALGDSIGRKTDSTVYHGHKIYNLDLPPFFGSLFGGIFNKVKFRSFTILNRFVIFGNSKEGIRYIIDQYTGNSTLSNNKAFIDFSMNLPDRYNVYTFYNPRNSIQSVQRLLRPELSVQLSQAMDSLKKIESVAFQFSNTDGLFYSNFFLRYNPNNESEGPLQWQARLDTTITRQPKIISIAKNEKGIIVTDVSNNMYLVSPDGEIKWKMPVMGKLISDIQTITFQGSDSSYILFNTDTHLYLLHGDGHFAEKFPMRFPLHATNALTLLREKNAFDYYIFIAFQDNRLYKFNLEGRSIREWPRPQLGELITQPVDLLHAGRKRYLAITGTTGKSVITDLAGQPAVTLPPGFTISPSSGFHENKTGRKGLFITTSPTGKLVLIQQNGKISEVAMNQFSPQHCFFYQDITGNGKPEFIFSDQNRIQYFSNTFKLKYSYSFRRDMKSAPFMLHGPDDRVLVGYVVPETNELFIFDSHGNRELESGIRGNTPFDIGTFRDDQPFSLIVGSGKLLKNYRLPKF